VPSIAIRPKTAALQIGGLKHNIGKVMADGHVLHADNPNPTFFDTFTFSGRQTELRTYPDSCKKLLRRVASGAELAEQLGVTMPLSDSVSVSKQARNQLNALAMLAQAEQELATDKNAWAQVALSSSGSTAADRYVGLSGS
jgi:hypothetical protein